MAPSLCSAVTKLNTTNDISRVLNCKQHPGHTTFFCFNVIFSPSSRSKMYISSALSYACTSWQVGPRGGVAYIYIYQPFTLWAPVHLEFVCCPNSCFPFSLLFSTTCFPIPQYPWIIPSRCTSQLIPISKPWAKMMCWMMWTADSALPPAFKVSATCKATQAQDGISTMMTCGQ